LICTTGTTCLLPCPRDTGASFLQEKQLAAEALRDQVNAKRAELRSHRSAAYPTDEEEFAAVVSGGHLVAALKF